MLDWEVYFPLAGYVGPGFHTWPGSADVLVGECETDDSHPKKGVRRSVRRRDRGQRPQLQKNRGARATTLGPQIRSACSVSELPDESSAHLNDFVSSDEKRP